jgi:hypothetical protein
MKMLSNKALHFVSNLSFTILYENILEEEGASHIKWARN